MIAVLSDCDCSKSKFTKDFIIGNNYQNLASLTQDGKSDHYITTMGSSNPIEFPLIDI